MLPAARTAATLRTRLRALIAADRATTMAALSRRIGKPPGYISGLLRRSDDTWLEPGEAEWLARYFGLEPGALTPD